MTFKWLVSTNTDPRTTEQSIMLTLTLGNVCVGVQISPATAKKMAKDLADGANLLDTGVIQPTAHERKIFTQ
jgi:hypothetical protein